MPFRGFPVILSLGQGAAPLYPTPNLFTVTDLGTLVPVSTSDGAIGVKIGVDGGASPKSLTHLYLWKSPGNSQVHTLYLIRGDYVIIASDTVDMSTGSEGTWIGVELASPVTISPGNDYYIYESITNGGDGAYSGSTYLFTDPDFAGIGSYFNANTPPDFAGEVLITPGDVMFGPVNAYLA